jgi:hypothetical protein
MKMAKGDVWQVELIVEGDELEWYLHFVKDDGTLETVDSGVSHVIGDALLDASRALSPFMPEFLR